MTMKTFVTVVAAVLVAVTLSGCGDGPTSLMNIVDKAKATTELSTLVGLLGERPDLIDTLSSPGPYTVFAPTNDAFAAISTVTAGLTNEQVTDILTYHVHTGKALSTDLVDGQIVDTLFVSHNVVVTVSGAMVTITDQAGHAATVTTANVECSNGVVHIVDAVLIPTAVGVMDIVATAQATPDLSKLVELLVSQDLVGALTGGMLTVFAPTDGAFEAVSTTTAGLSSDQLTEVLEYHVHNGKVLSTELIDGPIDTLFVSHDVTVVVSPAVKIIDEEGNDAMVTVADVECSNGVVHIVSHVLLPTLSPAPTPAPVTSPTPLYIQA